MADLSYTESSAPVEIVGTDPGGGAGTPNAAAVTSSGAVRVDGSAVTQPVSGTVTANAGTNLNTSALALDATLTGGTQKTKLVDTGGTNVGSISAAGALKVDGSAVTQPVSGTVTANIGTSGSLALDATLTGGTQRTKITDGTNNAAVKAASTAPVAADPAVVVAISPNTPSLTTKVTSSTATTSSVASSATNVTILALNTNRLGATVYNDSTKILYLKLGTTASTTDFTTQIDRDGYYEIPFGYTGRIDGIWASANGNARVTELT